MPTTLEIASRGHAAFQRRLLRRSLESAKRLQAAYRNTIRAWDDLIKRLEAQATSRDMLKAEAYRRLQQQIRQDLGYFSANIEREARKLQATGAQAGAGFGSWALDLVGVGGGHNRPDPRMLTKLVNYVDGDPFQATLAGYGPYHANQVANMVIAGVARGQNPVTTARQVRDYLGNMPMYDAVRMTRTVQLWAARQGNLVTYRLNSDAVDGWLWSAAIGDKRTCLSCIAQHGTLHPLSEVLNDHHLGRCAMLPETKAFPNRGRIQTGGEWFEALPESEQRDYMGPAKFAAWKDGAFTFDQLSTTYQNPVYGTMRREASLKELVGADRAKAYGRGLTGVQVPAARAFTGDVTQIRNIKDAEQWVKRVIPGLRDVDFSGMHIDPLKASMEQLDKLAKDWPQVAGSLKNLVAYDTGKGPYGQGAKDTWLAFAGKDGTIAFNRKYYGTANFNGETGHNNPVGRWTISTPGTVGHATATMTHEFGHQVDNFFRAKYSSKAFSETVRADGLGWFNDLFKRFYNSNRKTNNLSEYSTKNDQETAAEAFAAIYHLDKGKWPTIVKRYKELLDFLENPPAEYDRGQVRSLGGINNQDEREKAIKELEALQKELEKKLGLKFP